MNAPDKAPAPQPAPEKSFSGLFILRPVATTLLTIALLISGIVAYRLLPLSALPEVDYPVIQVLTEYPGASPDVMASVVTAPLETQFGQMPGLNQMTSTSSGGVSVVTLQFDLALSLDVAEQEVQQAINAAGAYLPTDLPVPPTYNKVNPADTPVMTLAITSKAIPTNYYTACAPDGRAEKAACCSAHQLCRTPYTPSSRDNIPSFSSPPAPVITHGDSFSLMPLNQVEDLVDTKLAQKISQVQGVGLVALAGGQRPAVRVQANPAQLAAHGLSLDDLRTAITANNVNGAKGSFDGPTRASTIDANDQIRSAAEYQNLVIAYRNGAPIRLQDVATVLDGVENARLGASMGVVADTVGGTQVGTAAPASATVIAPAIILNIQRQPGANVIQVVKNIRAMLPQVQATLPGSVDVTELSDLTTTIRASVEDVELELCFSILLVVAVIFVFLKSLRATLIPAVTVPLSLVGTFGVMYLAGYSINNLTLMALTIASGFVVDDAIVMIENIARYVEMGDDPLTAALKGAKQIGFTIVSLTVSLLAVLIPLLFMGDVVGRLFHQFAITLAVAIVISAILSLTLTPMMTARLLAEPAETKPGSWQEKTDRGFEKIVDGYDRALGWVLARQTLFLLVAVVTLAITALLYVVIPKGFFPLQDTGAIEAMTEAGQDSSFANLVARQGEAARIILADPAVANLSSYVGSDATTTAPNTGRLLINLKAHGSRPDVLTVQARLENALRHRLAGMQVYLQPVQDITLEDQVTRTQYQVVFGAPDAATLANGMGPLLQRLQQLPELAGVASDLQTNGLGLKITIDRATASRLGVTVTAIDAVLDDAFAQRLVSTIFSQTNQYRVVLEAAAGFNESPEALEHLYVTSSNGPQVPLLSVVQVQEVRVPLAVNRLGQFPAVTVSFNLAPGAALGNAVTAINQVIAQARQNRQLDSSVIVTYQGAASAFQSSLGNTLWLLLAAVVTVYIVLGVLYESTLHPLTILSTLPSAGIGALLALWLTGNDLGIIGIIGIILLIGIVKKNAIMVVDFALEAEREQGLAPEEAIRQASRLRFRPIIMTTLAALLGALPLMFGSGVGSELRHPLGLTMVGGLLLSQLLTLFTTPVIYLFFTRAGNRGRAWYARRFGR